MKILNHITKTKFILIYLTTCIIIGLTFYGTNLEKAAACGLAAFTLWWPGYFLFKAQFWTTAMLFWLGSIYQLYKMIKIIFY